MAKDQSCPDHPHGCYRGGDHPRGTYTARGTLMFRHEPPAEFAAALRRARRSAGISLHEMARRAGIAVGYACLLEQGKRSPSCSVAQHLVEAIGLTAGSDHDRILDAGIPNVGKDYRRADYRPCGVVNGGFPRR